MDEAILTPVVPLPLPRQKWAAYRAAYPDLTEEEAASAFIEVNRESEVPAVAKYSLSEAWGHADMYEQGEDDAWRAVWGFRLTVTSPPYPVPYRQGWVAAMSDLKERIEGGLFKPEWADLAGLQRTTNTLLSETYLQPAEVVELGGEFRSAFQEVVTEHNKKAPKLNKEPAKGHLKLLTFDQAQVVKSNVVVQDRKSREFNYLPVKPDFTNPFAMQPWNHVAFSPGTRGYKGAASQGAALKRAVWMAKCGRWFALTEQQAEAFAEKYGGPTPTDLRIRRGVLKLLEKSDHSNPFRKPKIQDPFTYDEF